MTRACLQPAHILESATQKSRSLLRTRPLQDSGVTGTGFVAPFEFDSSTSRSRVLDVGRETASREQWSVSDPAPARLGIG
jgi:hypothetical protein